MMRAREDDERVHHALDQGQRDHVAVRDVRDFVSENGLDFLAVHLREQAGADCHERVVAAGTGRESIGFGGLKDADLGHADACLFGLRPDGGHEPLLVTATRLRDDLHAHRPLRHPLRERERDERAAEAEHGREGEQPAESARAGEIALETEQPDDRRQHHEDGEVGREEQEDAFHP